MSLVIFGVLLFASFVMIPFGLPGLWIMIASAVGYDAVRAGNPIGMMTLLCVTVLAIVAEVLELTLSGRYTRAYGGSRRGARGAMIGGIVGAIIGVPVPLLGSLIGAFAGAFAGAFIAERSGGATGADSKRAATGALIGRSVAAAMKVGFGVVIAGWLFASAWS